MISSTINPIGEIYNVEDMVVDTVEQVYGIKLICNGRCTIIREGSRYKDSIVVGVFVHPESDCVWIVTKCNGVYFEVTFDGFDRYIEEYADTSKHIKDSTELSGGHLW